MELFALIFVRSFAMPDSAWAAMTYATETATLQSRPQRAREHHEGDDLEEQPDRAASPEPGRRG